MADELTSAAIVGTGRQAPVFSQLDEPLEQLLAGRATANVERELLIRAGSRSLARKSGFPLLNVPLLPASPAETGAVPSVRISQLLDAALSPQSIGLLPEFVRVLLQFHVAFPRSLFPKALELQDSARRELLRPALGERGKWLAQFHPAGSWMAEPSDDTLDVASLAMTFQEGAMAERVRALQKLREQDPGMARHVLLQTLPAEKGDDRRKLLEQLRIGLGPEDAPLLETLLKDRSRKVRDLVHDLLTLLPDSSLAQQWRRWGAQLIQRVTDDAGGGRLEVQLPAEPAQEWELAALETEAPAGWGQRAWRGRQLLSRIPPSFWSDRWNVDPAVILVEALQSDAADMLLAGWCDAAVRFPGRSAIERNWQAALWKGVLTYLLREPAAMVWGGGLLEALADVTTPADLDAGLIQLLQRCPDIVVFPWEALARRLSATWSPELSRSYLQVTRRLLQARTDRAAVSWCSTLLPAALGLAPETFAEALEPWQVSTDRQGVWRAAQLETWLRRFGEVVRIRREYREEIARCAASAQLTND